MKSYDITLTGTTPIMFHNERLANPLDEYVQRMSALNVQKKRKGTDTLEVLREMARVEWEGGLYIDKTGPLMPAKMLMGSLVAGAKLTRGGRSVQRAALFTRSGYPLLYEGPRDIGGLWDDGRFLDQRMVRVGVVKVLRSRPIFPEWSVKCGVMLNEDALCVDDLARYLDDAGTMEGIGDARRLGYGRFTVDIG